VSSGAPPETGLVLATGRELVLATASAGKLAELRALLAGCGLRLVGLAELPAVRLPEEGADYAANAAAKALAVAEALGLPALADDSGLEVEGLGGAPGPLSARYGGPGLSDPERALHLLSELRGVEGEARRARFVCALALATPGGRRLAARGECEGRILAAPRGAGGFGYDPVFAPAGDGRSFAELPAWEKNRVSHRARAVRALCRAARQPLSAMRS
jgi:XTP/dITP diphosphohydrolase